MQQDAIPFSTNPKSFAYAAFVLIAVTYLIQLALRHVLSLWPPLRRKFTALWLKPEELGKGGPTPLPTDFQPRALSRATTSATLIGDEENLDAVRLGTVARLRQQLLGFPRSNLDK